MIRFCLLGSGSSGNALLVCTPQSRILVDNGLSYRQLERRLGEVGERLDRLDAVLITHEHGDHVNGLGALIRRIPAPVFMTRATHEALPQSVGVLPRVEVFEAGETLAVADLRIASFSVSHDAADPVSYVLQCDGATLGIAADLGYASTLVRARLRGAHALVLEANYCPEMLRQGRYPHAVQQRIRSRRGHLSNQAMQSLLTELIHHRLRLVVLVHISEENNDPALAVRAAREVLRQSGIEVHVARQDRPTPMFEIHS